jgi:uncharacterized coiled-coil DUF342 family protein
MTDETYNDESLHTPESRDRDARFVGHEAKADTSKEAVERLAGVADLFAKAMKVWQHATQKHNEDVRDTLRALITERDALREEAEGAHAIIAAERAEVLKLREDLKNAAEVLAVYCDPMNMEPEHEMFSTLIINRTLAGQEEGQR